MKAIKVADERFEALGFRHDAPGKAAVSLILRLFLDYLGISLDACQRVSDLVGEHGAHLAKLCQVFPPRHFKLAPFFSPGQAIERHGQDPACGEEAEKDCHI